MLSGDEVGVGVEKRVNVQLAAGGGRAPAIVGWVSEGRVDSSWYMGGRCYGSFDRGEGPGPALASWEVGHAVFGVSCVKV